MEQTFLREHKTLLGHKPKGVAELYISVRGCGEKLYCFALAHFCLFLNYMTKALFTG